MTTTQSVEKRIRKLGIAKEGAYSFKQSPDERLFYVARRYSHTDNRKLWKILSRPNPEEIGAYLNIDFFRGCEPKIPSEDFFVIEVKTNYDPFR